MVAAVPVEYLEVERGPAEEAAAAAAAAAAGVGVGSMVGPDEGMEGRGKTAQKRWVRLELMK